MTIYHAYRDDGPRSTTYQVCWHQHRTELAAARCPHGDGRVVVGRNHGAPYVPDAA